MRRPGLLRPLLENFSPTMTPHTEDQDHERRDHEAYRECLVSHVSFIAITGPAIVTAVQTSALFSGPGFSWTPAPSTEYPALVAAVHHPRGRQSNATATGRYWNLRWTLSAEITIVHSWAAPALGDWRGRSLRGPWRVPVAAAPAASTPRRRNWRPGAAVDDRGQSMAVGGMPSGGRSHRRGSARQFRRIFALVTAEHVGGRLMGATAAEDNLARKGDGHGKVSANRPRRPEPRFPRTLRRRGTGSLGADGCI